MLRLLALALVALVHAGCTVSEEDKDFYYRGWVNPNEARMWNSTHAHHAGEAPPPGYKPDPLVD